MRAKKMSVNSLNLQIVDVASRGRQKGLDCLRVDPFVLQVCQVELHRQFLYHVHYGWQPAIDDGIAAGKIKSKMLFLKVVSRGFSNLAQVTPAHDENTVMATNGPRRPESRHSSQHRRSSVTQSSVGLQGCDDVVGFKEETPIRTGRRWTEKAKQFSHLHRIENIEVAGWNYRPRQIVLGHDEKNYDVRGQAAEEACGLDGTMRVAVALAELLSRMELLYRESSFSRRMSQYLL